jgi:ABC-2 type transport system ATP-binding protein
VSGVVARGVRKAYGATPALAGVELDVLAGSVHGLLGPNGAGKSTLLRVLLGLVQADAGTVHVDGVVAGFVETPGAYPYLTGRQNLELLAALDDDPGDVATVLGQVDLVDRADTKVSGWSLGMRQRLGIASGLLRRPDVLLLDEPANGLDPAAARSLRQLIAQLADDGLTVLLCSHDLVEVDALCSDVTVLVAGRVAWAGSVPELRARSARFVLTTSDDAVALGVREPGVDVESGQGELVLVGEPAARDRYLLALAGHGVAVRSLRPASLPLEEAFLELTR